MGGTLTAVIAPNFTTAAGWSGAGTLDTFVVPSPAAQIAYSGSGALDILLAQGYAPPMALSGAGVLGAPISPNYAVPLPLAGAGALSASAVARMLSAASLAGAGALSCSVAPKMTAAAALAGAGTLSATVVGALSGIEVIGTPVASTVSANSIALPTHEIGDLIIIGAARTNFTIPGKPTAGGTVPAWVDIHATNGGGSISLSLRVAYFVATANNHTSGAWVNANAMCAIVLRGAKAVSPVGGNARAEIGGQDPTAPAVTMTKTDGTSFLLHMYTVPSSNLAWNAPPAGYTRQVSGTTTTNIAHMCLNNKTVTTSDGAVMQTTSSGFSGGASSSIEILKA